MIILDTNVISSLMKEAPETNVVSWLDRQARTSIWTTSVTVFEVRMGISMLEHGKRRSRLMQSFDVFLDRIGHRIAPFDLAAAEEAASLSAERRRKGRPVELRDSMIAGVVLSQHAAIATRNVTHFNDVLSQVINPWTV